LLEKANISKQFRAFLFLMLAEIYHNKGYIYKAVRLCNESINLIPQQNLGYMTLSLIYGRLGLVDSAKEILSKIKFEIECNLFNDKYYTKETINATMQELDLASNIETEYLKTIKGK